MGIVASIDLNLLVIIVLLVIRSCCLVTHHLALHNKAGTLSKTIDILELG